MEFVTLAKETLNTYIDTILNDTIDFEYNNWKKVNFFVDLPKKWEYSVAMLNDNFISGFSINSRKSDIFYIHFFYIFKKFRKSKLGTALIKECEKRANEAHLEAIQLKCNKNNSSALNFYLNNGYEILKNDLTERDLYLLEKKIYKKCAE